MGRYRRLGKVEHERLEFDRDTGGLNVGTMPVSPQELHAYDNMGSIKWEPGAREWFCQFYPPIAAPKRSYRGLVLWTAALIVVACVPLGIRMLGSGAPASNDRPVVAGESLVSSSASSTTAVAVDDTGACGDTRAQTISRATLDFEPVTKSGRGPTVFALPRVDSDSLITATHNGTSPFTLGVVDGRGSHVATLVRRSGSYTGTTFIEAGRTRRFLLTVGTSGDWKIRIAPISLVTTVGQSANGNGDGVFFSCGRPGYWTLTYSGKSDFKVRLVGDSFGNVLASSHGPCQKKVLVSQSVGLLLVKAHGPWDIAMK
jgi:hypothetical protein